MKWNQIQENNSLLYLMVSQPQPCTNEARAGLGLWIMVDLGSNLDSPLNQLSASGDMLRPSGPWNVLCKLR